MVLRLAHERQIPSDPLRAGIGELTRLHQVGSHRHPAEVVVSIAERYFANSTRLVPGDHAYYSSGPMAERGPQNKLVT